ncbi:carbonic anhydrase family protein [Tamlana sp. 2201CG12-4]|uniref:carbonic anhydrase family protein n=1 Tax=Tamlana sp. 2201CG12-4 TaxID=3112582 RepID=UPI002DB88D23|nr:carbonic anhydrase family protein [Tamlana sp. 2201CG12-4]MEC3906062.1 carbonic anhydrase family protein [Tamlana sp. 2201CG12-4]
MKNIAVTKDVQTALSPSNVLNDLLEGNQRFVNNNMQAVDNSALVSQTVGGQYPKAVVLSCIDSRVPVETVLDQAIGDIFVARVAGNFENTDILGSLEYSCKVAGSKLILVLGHESCGAVKAACDGVELGNITDMLGNILPAVKKSADEVDGELNSGNSDFVAKTVENNVRLTIERIKERSPILKEMEANGDIQIAGGVYMLSSGKVEML